MDDVALGVGEDLHLDVTGLDHGLLDEDRRVAERALRLAHTGLDRRPQSFRLVDTAHAASAAPGHRLHEDGELEGQGLLDERIDVRARVDASQRGDSRGPGGGDRAGLVVAWYRGAMGEVAATLSAQDINPAGPLGGIFDTKLFTEDRGRVTIFLPCDPLPQPVERVSTTSIPPAELATIVHLGSSTEVDRTYGALADYVTQHELAADGPIREYYLVGPSDTRDESLWQTEVGWPIFQTRPRP